MNEEQKQASGVKEAKYRVSVDVHFKGDGHYSFKEVDEILASIVDVHPSHKLYYLEKPEVDIGDINVELMEEIE
jgi:hypothetical protein